MQFESKMIVSYNNTTGQIDFIGDQYESNPSNQMARIPYLADHWRFTPFNLS